MTNRTEPGLPVGPEASKPTREQLIDSIVDTVFAAAQQHNVDPGEIADVISQRLQGAPPVGAEPDIIEADSEAEGIDKEDEIARRAGETDEVWRERWLGRIVGGVARARISIHQGYDIVSEREGDAFDTFSVRGKSGVNTRPVREDDDLVDPAEHQNRGYPGAVLDCLQDYFEIPAPTNRFGERSEAGTFFVVGGQRKDTSVIQGAGFLARDAGGQLTSAAFKLTFDNETSYEMFRRLLVSSPSDALFTVFSRVVGEYSPLEDTGLNHNNRSGMLSYSLMSQAIPPKQGHFAFFADGRLTEPPAEEFTRAYEVN